MKSFYAFIKFLFFLILFEIQSMIKILYVVRSNSKQYYTEIKIFKDIVFNSNAKLKNIKREHIFFKRNNK